MKIFSFEPRSLDWWIFTLLPVLIAIGLPVVSYLTNGIFSPGNFGLQLLLYSIVLSCADLALWARQIRVQEEAIRYSFSIGRQLGIVLFCSFLLSQLNLATQQPHPYLVLSISLIFSYFSIWLYNHNPDSSDINDQALAQAKEQGEKNFDDKIQNDEPDSTNGDIKI